MKNKLVLFIKNTKRILYENKKIFLLIWSVSPFWIIYSCIVQLYEGIYPIFNNFTTSLIIESVSASLLQGSTHSSVYLCLGLIILATVLLHIILAIKNYIDVSCIDRINLHINSVIMQKISEKPFFHFESPKEMDKIERVRGQGSGKCIEQFNYTCALIFYDMIFGISTVIIMVNISWIISILFVIVISIRYVINIKLSRYNHTNDVKLTNMRRKINYLFNVAVTVFFAKEIKIFNNSDWILKRYEDFCRKYNIAHKRYIKKSLPIGFGSSVASTILYVISYYIIINKGIANGYSVGKIIFFTSSLSLFSSFLETLISHITAIYGSNLYTGDLFELLNENFGNGNLKTKSMECFSELSVRDISFTYPGTTKKILQNVSLDIKAGESICIVGRNGMGKSTLVKLILGLYTPDTGTITIDGKDMDFLKREGIVYASVVFQDFAKYSLTLKENIVFNQEIPDQDIIKILHEVDFSEKELEDLPDGLQTFMNREFDENGIVLSEGQWQRIAVARALCQDTPIIILDEPTSNLDPISEENIYNMINKKRGSKTIIMVSHRLSGAMEADKIIVIDDGRICGIGKHSDLINYCEIYNRMFNLQANRYLQKGWLK